MRRIALTLFSAWLAGGAWAEGDWTAMTGDEVRAALTGHTLRYNTDTIQDFRASGRTLYTFAGRDSWGYWAVRDDQYCSMWPPSDLWACYRLERSETGLRFVGQTPDDITEAVYEN